MNRYSVEITHLVESDLDDLGSKRDLAVNKILNLEENPSKKGSALKGNLRGLYSYKFNLPGSGQYRAIYYLKNKESICLLILVASRENIYQKAQRRYESIKTNN